MEGKQREKEGKVVYRAETHLQLEGYCFLQLSVCRAQVSVRCVLHTLPCKHSTERGSLPES